MFNFFKKKHVGKEYELPVMSRFIIFSVLFFIVILITGSSAFILSMQQIIRNNKGLELTQLLEIERVKLETSVNNEVVIVIKMADSPLIKSYFTNPGDLELARMAKEELISFRNAFASGIVFWINDIDKIFFYNDVEPYYLDPENPDNYWYNMTLYETEIYNFNINYNPDLGVTNLWINAPVLNSEGIPIGILGTGIDITTYLEMVNQNLDGRVEIYLFNATGEITGASDTLLVAEKKNIEDELNLDNTNIVSLAQSLAPHETQILDTQIGRIVVGTVPLLEWHSVAIMPDSIDDYNTSMTILFIVVLMVVVIIFIIFNIFISRLLKPLRKSIVEAAEANRAKSAFLANMSHEIRTPMNSIMGFAELARDLAIVPQVKDYLDKISNSTKWLLDIINDILDISKIEAGKIELEYVPFDLQDVFSRCQSVILPNVIEKGLELKIYTEPLQGKKLLGDPLRLYQVFMNLLSNAVKFTSSGTVNFSSSIRNLPDNFSKQPDYTTVYFEIKDTGIGLTDEQVKKIFAPFTQADSSTTRDYGGTGLGLTIAKNMVELMGGKLAVESLPDAGSTFSFEINFNTIDVYDDKVTQTKIDVLESPWFEGLVLICDDNSMNLEVICAHLARVGLQTIAVENGKLGVEMVKKRKEKNEKPFDMIFMDMFMPVMDGIEAASKIIELNTGSPIIAMTANIMTFEIEKYKKHGMPDCLGKPFTSQELWRILLKYLVPLGATPIDKIVNNDELQKKLMTNFIKNNQAVHNEIIKAVAAGDLKLAHRLAHTLKGNAGMIGKIALKNAASEIETMLRDGLASIWENKMKTLNNELKSVIEDLKLQLDEPAPGQVPKTTDREAALALFKKLGPMIENINPECVDLLKDIRTIADTEDLAAQIENYDFENASKTLAALIKKIGEDNE
ncbi:MAG: response regulator [Treponema sp.]|nr:response regulator [Treponema sp.]